MSKDYLLIPLKIKIPILAIIKVNNPKRAVSSDIFKPDANKAGSGFPNDSIESNAEINLKIEAKKPVTSPNKLLSVAKANIFLEVDGFVFELKKPFTINISEATKHIKISDIITEPPSVNKFDKKIDKYIVLRFC